MHVLNHHTGRFEWLTAANEARLTSGKTFGIGSTDESSGRKITFNGDEFLAEVDRNLLGEIPGTDPAEITPTARSKIVDPCKQ